MKKLFTICILAVAIGLTDGKSFGASCECFFTSNPWTVFIDPDQTVTEQFYVTRSPECEPPAYIWSGDCLMGSVDQNGLFTVPPTSYPETCTVCATDTANTYPGGLPVVCCAVIEIATPPDIDGDGRPDWQDNCWDKPNGPDGGTCIDGYAGDLCMANDDCGPGGVCSMNQEDSDDDYYGDVCDNCPTASNQPQNDSYPPQGNGIGDACECEGNFNCAEDRDVDGSDASTFKIDFGRSTYNNPCTTENPCPGNFNCDRDCDGTDAFLFKQDFGRSAISNPCPLCTSREAWCPECLPDGAECIYNSDCCDGCCCMLHFSGHCELAENCLGIGGGCRAY